MVTRILSCDLLIADIMISLPGSRDVRYDKLNALLGKLLREGRVRRGEKLAINEEQLKELRRALDGIAWEAVEPGGTACNILSTLGGLIGRDRIRIDFLGVKGGFYSDTIERGLSKAGIRLLPIQLAQGQIPESGLSFVFNSPEGKTTLTYPGNARDILRPGMITGTPIREADIVLIVGSAWEKLGKGLADALFDHCLRQGKRLWLALPTHAAFSKEMPPGKYRERLRNADVVLANEEELLRVYETGDFFEACRKLKADITPQGKNAVAFITRGNLPAAVISPALDLPLETPALPLPAGRKNYLVGAGDTAFAGFLAGHIAGLPLQASAELAMELSAAKIGYNNARIPNPRREMENGSARAKNLWKLLQSKLDRL